MNKDIFYYQRHSIDALNINGKDLMEVSAKSGIYFSVGYGFGLLLDLILPKFEETKSRRLLMFEVIYTSVLMGILVYLSVCLIEHLSKMAIGPSYCNKNPLIYVMMALPLFSVQQEFKKKLSNLLQKEENFKSKDDDEDVIMKIDHQPEDNSTEDEPDLNVDTLKRDLHVPPNPSKTNMGSYKGDYEDGMTEEVGYIGSRGGKSNCNSCNTGVRLSNPEDDLEARVNGYCASGDEECNGSWTDTKIKRNNFTDGFAGVYAGLGGAPLF